MTVRVVEKEENKWDLGLERQLWMGQVQTAVHQIRQFNKFVIVTVYSVGSKLPIKTLECPQHSYSSPVVRYLKYHSATGGNYTSALLNVLLLGYQDM